MFDNQKSYHLFVTELNSLFFSPPEIDPDLGDFPLDSDDLNQGGGFKIIFPNRQGYFSRQNISNCRF
jgi:hypothetical protein